ncbi:MAG: hypothetical protein LBU22_14055 [Dysgonamonadaceae bacterium]|jgi:hypothetical protein|nr:hypothetical protein [Dysgonamonadaceae bacterium]
MKTKKIIILGILLYFAGVYSSVDAQTIEKRVGNTVYVVDTVKRSMENKENKLFKTIDFSRDECYGYVREPMNKQELRKIFSEEHTKEWGEMGIMYNIICDSTGLICEVKFLLSTDELNRIPLSDFKKLEDYLKHIKLSLTPCPEKEYYTFIAAVSHRRVYGEK